MTALHFSDAPPLLSLLIFLPLAGVVALFFSSSETYQRWCTLATTLLAIPLALALYGGFDTSSALFQHAEHAQWIPWLGINYTLGVDGISLLMILLTVGIMPLCVLASANYIKTRVRQFHICLLLMETAMIGVFCALDAVLFFLFWEAMLIPMALLIGIWGGPRKVYAALKFFIYTMAGSMLMLVAIVALRMEVGTFHIPDWMNAGLPEGLQVWAFLAFFFAFAIKVPMFPFHTWLPDAHVEAPTAGSVILASILLKMGTYGFLRFCLPVTPYAAHALAPLVLTLSVVAIIYGGLAALAQSDMKKLVAYSSVGHMGFATLGIFCFNAEGITGGILVMLNHGIATGALFLCVGLLYERLHTRELSAFSGLGGKLPIFLTFFVAFCLSSMAFPGTNSFLGEFYAMAGAFRAELVFALLAVPGIVIAAAYILRVLQKIAFGSPDNPPHEGVRDVNLREILMLAPLFVAVFWIGLHPQAVMELLEASVANLVEQAALR